MKNKPELLNQGEFSESRLANLRKSKPKEIDLYERQLEELFEISFPSSAENQKELNNFKSRKGLGEDKGTWALFQWSNILLHIVGEDDYFALRTNRNKNLITQDEQEKLAAGVVGVIGLSVGSGIAVGCSYAGISNSIKIADRDELDTTNMNRLQVGVEQLYQPKCQVAARDIYECNPYATVIEYPHGVNANNVEDFIVGEKKLSIIVDEMDDFKMKVMIRDYAKVHKTPLLMMTSIGDNILIDVERYDIDDSTEPFLGLAKDAVESIRSKDKITPEDIKQLSIALVEKKHVSERALQSVAEIGKTLMGRPQLFSTVHSSAGIAIMLIREIILGNEVKSGRYSININEQVIK